MNYGQALPFENLVKSNTILWTKYDIKIQTCTACFTCRTGFFCQVVRHTVTHVIQLLSQLSQIHTQCQINDRVA